MVITLFVPIPVFTKQTKLQCKFHELTIGFPIRFNIFFKIQIHLRIRDRANVKFNLEITSSKLANSQLISKLVHLFPSDFTRIRLTVRSKFILVQSITREFNSNSLDRHDLITNEGCI